MTREIFLDTETTGMCKIAGKRVSEGHRIIEFAGVEVLGRGNYGEKFHSYYNPERNVDKEAVAVHGITDEFLRDKKKFREEAEKLKEFLDGAILYAHNSDFDLDFLFKEFEIAGVNFTPFKVVDTQILARKTVSGSVKLDVLLDKFGIDRTQRKYHGAMLDVDLLIQVYEHMTGKNLLIPASNQNEKSDKITSKIKLKRTLFERMKIIKAGEDENLCFSNIIKKIGDNAKWLSVHE